MNHLRRFLTRALVTVMRATGGRADWLISREMAPFASLVVFVAMLFCVVFCKMEVRRKGYSVLKLSREERQMRDHEREQMVQLAKITRPERLQAVAQARLTLKQPENGQIIQMTEQGVAFRQ